MKNLLRIGSVSILFIYSFYAHAIGDVIGGLGYSSYKHDSGTPSTIDGYNLNASLLMQLIGVNPIASIVLGPTLKLETVGKTESGIKETFSTLQAGAEGGVKVSIIPAVSLYGTVFATYGIANSLSIEMPVEMGLVADQTIKPAISNSWQTGVNLRAFYNVTSAFGVGAGFQYGAGSFHYDSSSIDSVWGPMLLPGETRNYHVTNMNLLAVFYL